MAYNRVTKKCYSRLNQMLLLRCGEYATARQWGKLGGVLRPGAECEIVVFWKMVAAADRDEEDGEERKNGRRGAFPVLRYYRVYHVSQVDGVPQTEQDSRDAELQLHQDAELLVGEYQRRENICIDICLSVSAYYNHERDTIVVPAPRQYTDIAEYYSTLFHEMVHSTGHACRLNRFGKTNKKNGSRQVQEELVAECGSAMLLSHTGLDHDSVFDNSAAYIDCWRRRLSEDPKLVVFACSQAEKAVRWILHGRDEMREVAKDGV